LFVGVVVVVAAAVAVVDAVLVVVAAVELGALRFVTLANLLLIFNMFLYAM